MLDNDRRRKLESLPRSVRIVVELWIEGVLLVKWMKLNLEMTMVKLGLLFMVVALYFHFKTGDIRPVELWASITMTFWVFFSIRHQRYKMKNKDKSAHWITPTQQRK